MTAIVTRDSLQTMLDNDNVNYVNVVIGRALVGIFNRQTSSEQNTDSTTEDNGVGFAGYDAYSGSLTAKYYLKHKSLLEWQRDMWTKKNKNGIARIAKYHKQLNEIAEEKQNND